MYQTLQGRNHVCIKHYRAEIMYVSNTRGQKSCMYQTLEGRNHVCNKH